MPAVPALLLAGIARPSPAAAQEPPAPVVVATFDTGTNPFHPCFRRAWPEEVDHPSDLIPSYPPTSLRLNLTFGETYALSFQLPFPSSAWGGAASEAGGTRSPSDGSGRYGPSAWITC